MPTLTLDGGKSFEVETGKKLVLAIEDGGVDILHKCGGVAKCTTCRVQILSGHAGAMNDDERERLAREASFGPDIRLSCQVRMESDLTVKVIATSTATGQPAGNRPAD